MTKGIKVGDLVSYDMGGRKVYCIVRDIQDGHMVWGFWRRSIEEAKQSHTLEEPMRRGTWSNVRECTLEIRTLKEILK